MKGWPEDVPIPSYEKQMEDAGLQHEAYKKAAREAGLREEDYIPKDPIVWKTRGKQTVKEPDIFDLDKDALDEEWITQPRLYFEHAEKLADAKREYELACRSTEVVEAELSFEIRSNPAKFGIEKITEDVVKKTISVQTSYARSAASEIKARHAMDLAQAMVNALDHRKKALENLVQLRLANYFSEPRVKGEAGDGMRGVERKKNRSSRSV